MFSAVRSFSLLGILACFLAGCGSGRDGALDIAMIGDQEQLFSKGVRLPLPAQYLRASTADGLVALDAKGDVVPALAERWIVTDGGRSYIFRLRGGAWPDGSELSSESVRESLRKTIRGLAGTSMGVDLARVSDVRAMAGRVVEVRLSGAMPDFLQLLAQPEMALFRRGQGMGSMAMERDGSMATLRLVPPELRGGTQDPQWKERTRVIRLHPTAATRALALFDEGAVDVVLGGQIEDLPRVDTGPLSRGTVRLERVAGMLGLQVRAAKGVLADQPLREAVAMAIDRDTLLARFNVGGWDATTRVVAPGISGDLGTIGERWEGLPVEQRQREAARRVAGWSAANGAQPARIAIWLPEGPGGEIVMDRLKRDLTAAGLTVERANAQKSADLIWVDRVARYEAAEWFLNQFNCSLRRGACSPEADARLVEARMAPDAASAAALVAEAEAELTAANVFIPIAAPLRWSLVRGDVTGFEPNRWAFHPLPPMAVIPR